MSAISQCSNPIIVPTAITRRFAAYNNLIFSGPSSTSSSELSNVHSVLEFPQIIISSDVILSTEDNKVLVTKRNENFDDQVIF